MNYELGGTWKEVKQFVTLLEEQRKIEKKPRSGFSVLRLTLGRCPCTKEIRKLLRQHDLQHGVITPPKNNSMCLHSKWGQEIRSDTQCRVRYLAVITSTTLVLGDARRHVVVSENVSFCQFAKQHDCDSNSENMFSPLKHEIYFKSFEIQISTLERPLQVRYKEDLCKGEVLLFVVKIFLNAVCARCIEL